MNVNAQVECGTIMEDDGFVNLANQNVSMNSFSGLEPYVLKVHFWDIYDVNGDNDHELSLETALKAVAELNRNYNAYNIYFKYDGIDKIFDSEYYKTDLDPDFSDHNVTIGPYMYNNNHFVQGAINVYSVDQLFVNGTENGPQLPAAGVMKWGNEYFKMILMRHDFIDPFNELVPATLTHEVGHFFSLFHTFFCGASGNNCENVTREITDVDCYNADTDGDKIIDTNATPYPMVNTSDCLYSPNGELDNCGVAYNAGGLEPEVENFMGYSYSCMSEFTSGQAAYMRWYIDYMAGHPDGLYAIETHPVELLYEPYQGDYAPYYPHPIPWTHPLFQPGFDYQFVECGGEGDYPQPADYSDTSFYYDNSNILLQIDNDETNFNSIVHPNHSAIRILQITSQQPRKCYDNYNSPDIIGGIVVKFNDNVFNTNVTITTKDSTSINNEELIDDLQPGLYNIIKNYENGESQENVIYKENN